MIKKYSNLLVIDGGTVKTSDEGFVEGFGIVFGSEDEPDQSAQRDFFTEDSFIRKNLSFTVPLYYEHGLGAIDTEIGEATLTKEKDGWKATAMIDTSDPIAAKVYEAVKEKPHGFSTGALQHLVKREARGNNTNFLKQWVVGELSLTERPAERKAVVQSVKSINGELVTEDAFSDIDSRVSIELLDENGDIIWVSGDEVKALDELKPHTVTIKYGGGSTTYRLYYGDDDDEDEGGFELEAYVWGGTEDLITKLQNMLNVAAMNIKEESKVVKTTVSVDEEEVETLIKKLLKEKSSEFKTMLSIDSEETDADDADGEHASDWEAKAEELNNKLADLEKQLADREDALTKANENIARLEILAGAKETIEKNKGK